MPIVRRLFLLLAFTFGAPALAQPLPRVVPEVVGLSAERLERLTQAFQNDIEKGAIPGVVMAVARHGKLAYWNALGFRDRAANAQMTDDAIFRIYSMTKPYVSVGVMMLVEEGKVVLGAPISTYLPALGKLKVGVEKDALGKQELAFEAAKREMTVQDLLRHTSGLTYGVFGRSLVKQLYNDAKVMDVGQTNAEMVEKLGKLPLAYEPGTRWEYSMSTDVLGALIEAVSGVTLDRFLAERIFKPLGMVDSGFSVPPDKHGRIAEAGPEGNPPKPPQLIDVRKPPRWLSGGGGGVGTAADYLRFAQMLLDGGEFGDVRLLGRKTVELMTADHLGVMPGMAPGYGFGLGFGVRREIGIANVPGSVGEYFWSGFGGTAFWIDPQERLVAVLMMQNVQDRNHYRRLFQTLVMQALVGR
jgi:CubicO group peptidase (beta-lactamase class C family)